ncbi:MAG: CmcI family methyltransferase [Gammaproteobacteria bacterium]
MIHSAAIDQVLLTYKARMEEERIKASNLSGAEAFARRDEFLLSVGEDVATLMQSFIIGLRPKIIVELGTSYGYSTVFLAAAARQVGGKVFTYEIAPAKQAYARAQIAAAELSDVVEWRLGDAVGLLADQIGPVDFVLMDLWKELYVPCFDALYPKLAANGVIVADNMLFPEIYRDAAAVYRAAVRFKKDMQAVLLPMGQGIDVSCRVAEVGGSRT